MKRSPVLPVLAALAALFFSACGIEDFIYLYPVVNIPHDPTSSEDESAKYFCFTTRDSENSSAEPDNFKGYEIYYRIYNTASARATDVSAISTANDSNPTGIVTVLTGRNYQRMTSTKRLTNYPLIPGTGTDRTVYIRLADYETVPSRIFAGALDVDSLPSIDSSEDLGIPLRTMDGLSDASDTAFRFDPEEFDSDDGDVSYSTSGDGCWYVQAYVVAYGYDGSYKSIYSEAKSLGAITLPLE
jgi:hypothetical protein